MINLLPSQYKNEILQEERWKIFLILSTVLIFFLIAIFFILLIINIIVLSNLEIKKIYFEQEMEVPEKLYSEDLKNKLSDFNQIISGVEGFYQNQFVLADAIEKISRLLIASDIYLADFNFVALSGRDENFAGQIYLAGFAPKRDSLLEFRKNLENVDHFQEINFPSSNWVKPANINFTVNFKVENFSEEKEK